MNLKNYREKSKVSQMQLAKMSGVSVRMIQKYEISEKDINKAQAITLYRLSKVLECQIENLLEVENE